MNTFQFTCLILFGAIFYIMLIDTTVSDYINLIFKMWRVNIGRYYWLIRFHPRNPITNFIREQQFKKIAKEIEKEFQSKM